MLPYLLFRILRPLVLCFTVSKDVGGSLSQWPKGTVASASSIDSSNRDYRSADYAIDGDIDTAWLDGTPDKFPDSFTLRFPNSLKLSGLFLLSGYPLYGKTAYRVHAMLGNTWSQVFEATNITTPLLVANFDSSVECS